MCGWWWGGGEGVRRACGAVRMHLTSHKRPRHPTRPPTHPPARSGMHPPTPIRCAQLCAHLQGQRGAVEQVHARLLSGARHAGVVSHKGGGGGGWGGGGGGGGGMRQGGRLRRLLLLLLLSPTHPPTPRPPPRPLGCPPQRAAAGGCLHPPHAAGPLMRRVVCRGAGEKWGGEGEGRRALARPLACPHTPIPLTLPRATHLPTHSRCWSAQATSPPASSHPHAAARARASCWHTSPSCATFTTSRRRGCELMTRRG